MFTAWQTARLSHYSGGRLKPLGDCLRDLRPAAPKRSQTSDEKIAALRAIMATMGNAREAKG